MKKRLITLGLVLSCLPLTAHADKKELEGNLYNFIYDTGQEVWPAAVKSWRTPERCREIVAEAKQGGYADADAVGGAICDAFDEVHRHQTLRVAVQIAYDSAEWMRTVKPEEASNVEGMSKTPQACLDALDQLGTGEIVITSSGGYNPKKVKVEDARAVCTQALADATKFERAVTEREQAAKAAMEAEYTKAGAKGDKLAWLIDRGPGIDGWYLKGCKEPKDAKALVKASVWFQWFYPPEGGHMIRRIQFKGNKQVKVTEKHYWTEEKAYRGCK
jgi:hypothetical protein